MGSVDFGTQTQTFDFGEPADSENFNKINYKLHQKGIYDGGTLTYIDADTVQISPLTCYIIDSTTGNGVRIETAIARDIDVTETTADYIILRFNWSNVTNNYMDMLAVAWSSIVADDIIVGKAVFKGGTLDTAIDYTRRTTAHVAELESNDQKLRVVSQEVPANTVYVYGGTIRGSASTITVASDNSPAISATTLGRVDLVWIDPTGAIKITEGSDSGTPSAPAYGGRFVIAEITRGASRSVVTGDEITWVNPANGSAVPVYLPVGTIWMYDGGSWVDNDTIPGWYACVSGNTGEGAPDLENTFVMGSAVLDIGTTGGSNTHTITSGEMPTHSHTGTSANQSVSHTHGVTTSDHTHTGTTDSDGAHSHLLFDSATNGDILQYSTDHPTVQGSYGVDSEYYMCHTSTEPTIGRSATMTAHTHTFTTAADGGETVTSANQSTSHNHTFTTDTTGNGTQYDSRPAYYSLIFIRKCYATI